MSPSLQCIHALLVLGVPQMCEITSASFTPPPSPHYRRLVTRLIPIFTLIPVFMSSKSSQPAHSFFMLSYDIHFLCSVRSSSILNPHRNFFASQFISQSLRNRPYLLLIIVQLLSKGCFLSVTSIRFGFILPNSCDYSTLIN